ncbi:TIR domain-containing protein [Microscilla marina]|uniref:TIR domain-containing protein n=1 Tax=Microscilla marina TaxID=1027 RepID=UPI0006A753B8|nr:nucleotide-binding protein [Microscilla marina]
MEPNNSNQVLYELDKTNLEELKEDIIMPYLQQGDFHFNGCLLTSTDIIQIIIQQSQKTTQEHAADENTQANIKMIPLYTTPYDILAFDNYVQDITSQVIKECKSEISQETQPPDKTPQRNGFDNTEVFIVHGHDDSKTDKVARFIQTLSLVPIILSEQASGGQTIIDKLDSNSNVGYGIVLYTPCDQGSKIGDEKDAKKRARQNVVFEHGFLIGKLGRSRVCVLITDEEIEKPNDISGVLYIKMHDSGWQLSVAKELNKAGYDVDANSLIK